MPDVNRDALKTDLLSIKELTKMTAVLSPTTAILSKKALYLIQRRFWLKDEIQACGKSNLLKK